MSKLARHQGDKMSKTQIELIKIIESLVSQIELTKVIEGLLAQMSQQSSQQAQKIASLEATVNALLKNTNP
jgi:hypothetical protein